MGFFSKLKFWSKEEKETPTPKEKEETTKLEVKQGIPETIEAKPRVRRSLDLLAKLEKLDELDVKTTHIIERTNDIFELINSYNTQVLDKLVKLDELDKLDEINLTLKERLKPSVEKAVEEIKLTFKLQKILEVFKERETLSTKEVSLMFNTSKATASKQLKTLEKLGLIKSVGVGVYQKVD